MSDIFETIEEFISGFDEIREQVLPEGVRLFLLQKTNDGTLVSVRKIDGGWIVEYGQTRNEIKISIATNEPNFNDDFVRASFIAYGVPSAGFEMSVYVVLPELSDATAPDLTSPFWTATALREPSERFVAPHTGGVIVVVE